MIRSFTAKTWQVITTSFVLLVVIIIGVFEKGSIITFLKNNKLLPEPERYTELYFENYQNFPTTLSSETKTFRFTIHNLEFRPVTYPYVVYEQDEIKRIPIDQNTITLTQNEFKTITESYLIATPSAQEGMIKVEVNLVSKKQQIDFLLHINKTN